MKICFLTYSIFDLGGIQRVVSVIASELAKTNDVEIICTCDNYPINYDLYNLNENIKITMDSSFLAEGKIKSLYLRILKKINRETGIWNNKFCVNFLSRIYYPRNLQKRFIGYINENNYDVVISVAGENSLLLGIVAEKIKCKKIGWEHNSYDAYLKNPKRYFWKQDAVFNKYIPKLDEHLVLTDYDRKMYLKNNKIDSIVMPNPRSFSSNIKSDVIKKQFLAAGRFTYQKGFDLLIKAFYEFSKLEEQWNLVIVGEGEEKQNIINLIQKYNLEDRITIENFTDNIQKYFLESSTLLLSSRWEGMPMIVLESLEMGVPVISFNITAVESLIEDNEEGFIVSNYNIEEFSKAMYKISKSYDVRKKFSKNAMLKSEVYNVNNIVEKWNKLMN